MVSTVQRRHFTKVSCPDRRYPIEANVEYKVIRGYDVKVCRGKTVTISSSKIVFQPEYPIAVGLTIEAYVDWPARLDNVIALRLHVHGETIQTENGHAAVRILRHDFRTAGQNRTLFVSGTEDTSISSVAQTF